MPSREGRWMLYGATGYTGRWIARQAQRDGLAPVLAGRASEALVRLAQETALPSVAVGLDQPGAPTWTSPASSRSSRPPMPTTSARETPAC